jgi:hypothetical protein
MLNAVRRLLKPCVPLMLKRQNGSGMTYRELIEFLDGMRWQDLDKTQVKLSASDLQMLILATKSTRDAEIEERSVKTDEGWVLKVASMWGDSSGMGMREWLEVVPVPGVNFSALYRFDRFERTGL